MNPNLQGADLLAWRESHQLSQDEMADLLGVAREWLSKIENGHKPVSAALFLRFEALKRDPRFTSAEAKAHSLATSREEEQLPYGVTPQQLRQEIEQLQRQVIAEAGEDVARLGWILIQTQTHLKVPPEWKKTKTKRPLIVDAPPHHRNPVQPASGARGLRKTG